MRRSLWIIAAIVVTGSFGSPCVFAAPPEVASEKARPEELLEEIVNFPFETSNDMDDLSLVCRALHGALDAKPERDERTEAFSQFLEEVALFTSTEKAAGEEFTLVSFATSNHEVVRRLRTEIGLPPPKGAAIVRRYRSREDMPYPILALFEEDTRGITRWCRFVAVIECEASREQLEDTIGHELAHAYIASCLGLDSNRLPKWFHEGAALYLSDGKDQYVSQTDFGRTEIISWSPRDYNEYRLVFRYLRAVGGRRGVGQFIRDAVAQQSVEEPLRKVAGTASYDELLRRATGWDHRRQLIQAMLLASAVGVVLFGWRQWGRRRQRRTLIEAAHEYVEAGASAQQHAHDVAEDIERLREQQSEEVFDDDDRLRRDVEELALALVQQGRALAKVRKHRDAQKKFEEAMDLAGWSNRVRVAVQQAVNEMNGIYT